ncbi:MAG: NAD(P)/FAD-dependent oxidoreductase [Flavisolibacter sp.]
MSSSVEKKLIVIGGGAAGFFCAVNAARLNPLLKVIILEKTHLLLSKVRVSGGGRCNLTHAHYDISEMSKGYPRGQQVMKKTFYQFFTTHTINWFEQRGIHLKTEKDGRMFPQSDSSQTIIDCLLEEAKKYNVLIEIRAEVKELTRDTNGKLTLANGTCMKADFVCVASGGYSKIAMFNWFSNLGLEIAPPVPSLFTFNLPGHPMGKLMGISVGDVKLKIGGTHLLENGPLLITHWGVSGPAVLKLSAWAAKELAEKNYFFTLHINWLPVFNEQILKNKFQQLRASTPSKSMASINFTPIPNRLWIFLLGQSGIAPQTHLGSLTSKESQTLFQNLLDYRVEVKGKTTFKDEFVTAGGIETREIDIQTMMSKRLPGLFFAGEVLNVDGITGGYNFQHAWTSGWIAAKTIAAMATI